MTKQFDINTATVQEACDYALAKIVEQGGRCYDDYEDYCLYSDNSGKHCAVGWLLPHDDEDLMEYGGTVDWLIVDYPYKVPSLIEKKVLTFRVLQKFHDTRLSSVRKQRIEDLQQKGIDTSAPQYQQWVEMGV